MRNTPTAVVFRRFSAQGFKNVTLCKDAARNRARLGKARIDKDSAVIHPIPQTLFFFPPGGEGLGGRGGGLKQYRREFWFLEKLGPLRARGDPCLESVLIERWIVEAIYFLAF